MRLSQSARILVVITLIALDNALNIPDIARVFGFGLADYGFTSSRSVITQVTPGGPAELAGLRVGDRITAQDHSERANYGVVRGIGPYPGAKMPLSVSGPPRRHVVLVAVHEAPSRRFLIALRFALAALTIGVAAALLLTRPEPATWGFLFYCLGAVVLPGATSVYLMPWKSRELAIALLAFVGNTRFVGGVLFAWTFAGQALKGRALAAVLSTSILTLLYTCIFVAGTLYNLNYPNAVDSIFYAMIVLAMLAGFIHSYHHDDAASRQRLKWMIAALVITAPITYLGTGLFPSYINYGQYVALIGLQAVLPVVAAYAMFRKRVVDPKFVISHTLVYGTLTAITACIFAVFDELFWRWFEEWDLGIAINVAIALTIGFFLDRSKEKLDFVVDVVLFRDRYHAERTLRQGAADVVHAASEDAVRSALVRLPVDALRLTDAALYMRNKRDFREVCADEDAARLPQAIDADDPLALMLRSRLHSVRMSEVRLSAVMESRHAVLAIPLTMRSDIAGFVVYGAHRNGADIDRDELKSLEEIAKNAAVALDHIDAESLRSRVALLERMLAAKTPSSS
ncbi:MAG TPA: PDZ domain-containing protein [Candidatus Aquilonibacter sp.]